MADFCWLTRLIEAEWEKRANGSCLKAMRWRDFEAKAGAAESGFELVSSFRVWAEKQREEQFALTWDVPITATSYVYVCKLSEESRRSA